MAVDASRRGEPEKGRGLSWDSPERHRRRALAAAYEGHRGQRGREGDGDGEEA